MIRIAAFAGLAVLIGVRKVLGATVPSLVALLSEAGAGPIPAAYGGGE